MSEAKKIIVVKQGWVFLGRLQCLETGGYALHDAWVVRKWGTTKGLGELALSGPTKATVLDAAGVIKLPEHGVLAIFDCGPWSVK